MASSMISKRALWEIVCRKICKLTTQLLTSISSRKSKRISLEQGVVSGAVNPRKSWTRTSWWRLQKISVLANLFLARPTPTTILDWIMQTILHSTRQSFTVRSIRQMRLSSGARSIILSTARNASPITWITVAIRYWPRSHTVSSNNS